MGLEKLIACHVYILTVDQFAPESQSQDFKAELKKFSKSVAPKKKRRDIYYESEKRNLQSTPLVFPNITQNAIQATSANYVQVASKAE